MAVLKSVRVFAIPVYPADLEKPEARRQQSEDQRDKTLPLTNKRVSGILIDAILFLSLNICSCEIIIFGCTLPLNKATVMLAKSILINLILLVDMFLIIEI